MGPVLTYGLESIPFTKELKNRVDYFQTKCLRNIMKIKAAYYSQVSNKDILNKVSTILYDEVGKVSPISRTISDRAITLLGHIVRSDENDHMRKVALNAELLRVERAKRRVGRPRFYWLSNTMERAHKLWRKANNRPKVAFNILDWTQRRDIETAALGRCYPFKEKQKEQKEEKEGNRQSKK